MIDVFISENDGDNEVAISMDGRSFDGMIHTDENGKFFMFKKNKIYLSDLLPINFKRLNEKIDKKKKITPLEFLLATRNVNEVDVTYPYAKEEKNKTYTMHNSSKEKWDDEYDVTSVKIEEGSDPIEYKKSMNSYNLSFLLNMGLMRFIKDSAF